MGLSYKSKTYLTKLKAQSGLQFPYVQGEPLDLAIDNTQVIGNAPLIGGSLAEGTSQAPAKGFDVGNALGMVGSGLNLITGVSDIFNSFEAKRLARAQKAQYDKEYKKSREEAFHNDFYYTPYSVPRAEHGIEIAPSHKGLFTKKANSHDMGVQEFARHVLANKEDYSPTIVKRANFAHNAAGWNKKQSGGEIGLNSAQGKQNEIDDFLDYYNSQQNQTNKRLMNIKDTYSQENQKNENYWKNMLNSGVSTVVDVANKAAQAFAGMPTMQDGGEQSQEQSLYDPNFNPDWVNKQEEVQVSESMVNQQEMADQDMNQFLLEDTNQDDTPYQNFQSLTAPKFSFTPSKEPISDTQPQEDYHGESIAVSMNNPGNIKMGSFASKYGASAGRPAKDGGVFAKFPTVEAGLQAQQDLLQSEGYKNLTVGQAMKRWSNSGYGEDLYPEIANKKMSDLTPDERKELQRRQIKMEDGKMYKKIYG